MPTWSTFSGSLLPPLFLPIVYLYPVHFGQSVCTTDRLSACRFMPSPACAIDLSANKLSLCLFFSSLVHYPLIFVCSPPCARVCRCTCAQMSTSLHPCVPTALCVLSSPSVCFLLPTLGPVEGPCSLEKSSRCAHLSSFPLLFPSRSPFWRRFLSSSAVPRCHSNNPLSRVHLEATSWSASSASAAFRFDTTACRPSLSRPDEVLPWQLAAVTMRHRSFGLRPIPKEDVVCLAVVRAALHE
ncbi:unnamed protein product [Protopolystoma xenopodis]|uniref:Uncharacterized protein n=1 Tax=Protopolystoma xenopodis TaxID=117903 RepID=A0A448XBD6_9PLAT|nr:unnamed protein product [Protopolystoma xenopodis]